MNYYAQGGQAQGLKSLAQEMRSYGRNGDTMLAHINPEEAMILKAMGGSGTINPDTGLPEYFLKSVFKPVQDVWKGITNVPGIKQVSDAVTPVMQTLAPYAPYIAPFIPGIGPLMSAAIGAAGAGFGGKGRSGFDFKRGLMGGMTAYGLSNLYTGLQAAASTGADATASQVASNLGSGASSAPGSQAAMLAEQSAGLGEAGLQNIASSASYANPANFVGGAAEAGAQAVAENAPNAGMFEAAPNSIPFDKSLASSVPQSLQMSNLSSMPSNFATEMSNAGSGLKNLAGMGDGMSQAAKAVGTKFGTGSAAAIFTGMAGMSALDEQQKYLDEQKASGNIAQSEYDAQAARISEARARAEQAMRDNPYQFAVGGTVGDENGMDEARGLYQGNMSNGFMNGGSIPSYAQGGEIKGYAGGGTAQSSPMTPGTYDPKRVPNAGRGMPDYAYRGGFPNLPPMSGALGAVGLPTVGGVNPFNQEQMSPEMREMIRVQGGGRDEQGRTIDGLGNIVERTAPSGQSFGQIIGGLSNMFPNLGAPLNSSIPNNKPQSLAGLNQQLPTGSIFNSSTGMGSSLSSSSSAYPNGDGSGAFPLEGKYGIVKMAAGGMPPRFLSGGGDGMSDSIKANINGTQEARLADGEFVIPADVVSHIGNGSSKAGAKQLYSMMDRVRQARVGTKKQGKQINPRKYMAA